MTFKRGQANRPVGEQDASLSINFGDYVGSLRGPGRVPQPAEALNFNQRQIDHMMRCTKVGCLTCQS